MRSSPRLTEASTDPSHAAMGRVARVPWQITFALWAVFAGWLRLVVLILKTVRVSECLRVREINDDEGRRLGGSP